MRMFCEKESNKIMTNFVFCHNSLTIFMYSKRIQNIMFSAKFLFSLPRNMHYIET